MGVGGALLLVGLGFYAYNMHRNFEAAERVRVACEEIGEPLERVIEGGSDWLDRIFGEERAQVEADLRAATMRPCEVLPGELVWWKWNFGRLLTIDPDPEGRVRQAGERVSEQCPALMDEMLAESPFLREASESSDVSLRDELCGQLEAGLVASADEEPEPHPVWEWPEILESTVAAIHPARTD